MKLQVILVVVVINALEFTRSSSSSLRFWSKKPNDRIVGGLPISIVEAPWIVQLLYNNQTICAGSIVSSTKVLSAAHCIARFKENLFTIRAGADILNEGGQVIKVSKTVVHPDYLYLEHANDISILSLEESLLLSPTVAIIDINENPLASPQGTELTIVGWGKTCENCEPSETLQMITIPTVDNEQCRRIYEEYQNIILPSMLCGGLESDGKGSCHGDSGGPVNIGNSLVGIVSFGVGCAKPNIPDVFTRVSYFASWIRQNL